MEYEVNCKHCGRFFFNAIDTAIASQLPCGDSRCPAKLNIKIVNSFSSLEVINFKFSIAEQPPKKKEKTNE